MEHIGGEMSVMVGERGGAVVHDEEILFAVVCGSFHRDVENLRAHYSELISAGCSVLSPQGVDFVAEKDGFVYSSADLNTSPRAIEANHLAQLARADFIWLHAPMGYVGLSAAMEMGFARAIGTPVYTDTRPADVTIAEFVTLVAGPAQAVTGARSSDRAAPSDALAALQSYYSRVSKVRGYGQETPQDCMLLLTEEIGELARAVRTRVGLVRDGSRSQEAAVELADVQLYLVHMANIMRVDLAEAVREKEEVNGQRYLSRPKVKLDIAR